MKYIYGIDFGTSNSVLAVLDITTQKVIKTFKEASLLYFHKNGSFHTGEQAINEYLGNDMQGRLLKSVKTLLPQSSFTYTWIAGKKYTAEDLVALILKTLKAKADAFTGVAVEEVMLGRPVVFSTDPVKDQLAEKRLRHAAQLAGFKKIWIQYEPIAAGFLHEQSLDHPQIVLIGDFGGGTSDFTLMRLGTSEVKQSDRKKDILQSGGIHIGGDDFDADIMWHRLVQYFGYGLTYESSGKMLELPVHIFRSLCEWEQMGFLKEGTLRKKLDTYFIYAKKDVRLKHLMDLIDHNLGFSLFQTIEKSKISIAQTGSGVVDFHKGDICIQETITIEEFNAYAGKDIDSIRSFVKDFLSGNQTAIEMVDHIFLTGGSSLVPEVQGIFVKIFGEEKVRRGDNFNSVAEGLAWSYLSLSSEDDQ